MRNVSIRFVPLEQWPHKATPTKESNFSARLGDTWELLDKELWHVGARNVVLQAFFSASQLRGDGLPNANARPSRPGIILSFTTRAGSLSFPCYRFTTFEDNLRAVALSLEALRKVDRYGVTQSAEQYQGWKQIDAPGNVPFPTREDAARFVSVKAYQDDRPSTYQSLLRDSEARKRAYRSAAALLHPDNQNGGNHEEFVLLGKAMEMLDSASN